ncbi:hypothetical protein EMIT0111MI5_130034 [Burkholderia sp. IT-111MI5]
MLEDPLADEREPAGRDVLADPPRRFGDVAVRGILIASRHKKACAESEAATLRFLHNRTG